MKKFNHSWLPYMGAAVQAGLFALAGYHYFNLGLWGAVVGFGVGAVVSFSLAVAASKIADIAGKRKPLAYLALFVMICLSPATVALSLIIPGSVFTAIAWAMDTDIAIVLAGAIAGKSLVAKDEPVKSEKVVTQVRKTTGKRVKVATQVARKPVTDDMLLAYLASNPGERQQQVAEHFGVSRQAIGQRVKKLYEVKQ
jgi:hypothetical protein